MDNQYKRNDSGLCINTDNTAYQHILSRRHIDERIKNLESTVGGIANSINTIIEMIARTDKKKLDRESE